MQQGIKNITKDILDKNVLNNNTNFKYEKPKIINYYAPENEASDIEVKEELKINKEQVLNRVSYNIDENKKISNYFSKEVYRRFKDKIDSVRMDEVKDDARVK